jgi:hypothetical protein
MVLKSPTEYMHIETLILIFKAQNLLYAEVTTNLTSFFRLSVSALALSIPFKMIDWCFGFLAIHVLVLHRCTLRMPLKERYCLYSPIILSVSCS